jgi:hypothetical protein
MAQVHADFTNTSASEADLVPGSVAQDENGTIYVKCKAGGTIGADEWCQADTTGASLARGFVVMPVVQGNAVDASETFVGWNKTGVSISSGEYFWAAKGPVVRSVKVGGLAVTAGVNLYTATSGQLVSTKDANELKEDSIGIAMRAEGADDLADNRVDILRHMA